MKQIKIFYEIPTHFPYLILLKSVSFLTLNIKVKFYCFIEPINIAHVQKNELIHCIIDIVRTF